MDIRFTFGAVSAAVLFVNTAFAVNLEVSVNTSRQYSSVSDADVVEIGIEDNRSYCCQISAENHDSVPIYFLEPTVSSGTIQDVIARGDTAPWVRDNSVSNSNETRYCLRFSEMNTGQGLDNGRARGLFKVQVDFGTPSNVIVKCDETALFGGFNTSVTDFNFIEITNTLADTDTTEPVTVNIRARGTIAGAELLDQNRTLTSGQRIDVNLHDVVGTDFGPVVITHNGPKGAIRAVNVQYRIVSTEPLDFEPVLSVPFKTRD